MLFRSVRVVVEHMAPSKEVADELMEAVERAAKETASAVRAAVMKVAEEKYPSKRLVAGDEEQRRHDLKNAVLEVLDQVDKDVSVANLTRCCALRVLHSQRQSPGTGSDSSACLDEK